ncbi:MAG: YraN family protein [Firmicutes bacterium]|nr:YraN family protein [Bacillota bacterium]
MAEDRRTPKRRIGDAGEDAACSMLVKDGCEIIARNFSCRTGEIDIIAVRPQLREILFIEVKTRRNTDFGYPSEFVGKDKQRRLKHTAEIFLFKNPRYRSYSKSMDIIEILHTDTGLFGRHITNAF